MSAFDWSLPLGRIAGIRLSAHWSLLLILLYDAHRLPPIWWLPMTVALFGSILLHELGHALAARSVGGDCRKIELWMLGGLAHCETPMRPFAQFAVSIAGILVNALIAATAYGIAAVGDAGGWDEHGRAATFLSYLVLVNVRMVCFNLLPAYPLDGGKLLRSVLWPMVGLRRATTWTILLAYPAALGLVVYGGWRQSMLWLLLGAWLLLKIVQEHTVMRLGEFEQESWMRPSGERGDGWFARWRAERARRARERRERAEQDEQDAVDRLLAKVSEQGLAALTKQERATLEAYSRKQRERQEPAGRR